jgi:hypothetical protein
MYRKTKGLGWKDSRIQNIGSQGKNSRSEASAENLGKLYYGTI